MKIEEVLDSIEHGKYPTDPKIEIPAPFDNDAGSIFNIARGSFGSASLIKSVRGAVRSNHYHQTDSHFIYVLSGMMYYYWRPAGIDGKIPLAPCDKILVKAGELIFTPPLVAHATYFPAETTIVTLNKYARDHRSHEADVVRVPPLITNEVCPAVLMGHRCCLPFETTRDAPTNNIHCGTQHETIDGYKFGFGMFGGGFA